MLGSDRVQAPAVSLPHATVARPLGVALLAFAVATAAWYGGQVVVLDHSAAAAVTANIARTSAPLGLDQPLQVTVNGAGVQLVGAQLFRAEQSPAAASARGAAQVLTV